MAPQAKCPHCGKKVRIDKGLLRAKGNPKHRTWEADCPLCGGVIPSVQNEPEMVEVKITKKAQYLKENFPFDPVPKLNETRQCLHCDKVFTVKDFKVFRYKKMEFICCPNAPECNGSVIDWVGEKEF